MTEVERLVAQIAELSAVAPVGRVARIDRGVVQIAGLASDARHGDQIKIRRHDNTFLQGEVVQLDGATLTALTEESPQGIALQDLVFLTGPDQIFPSRQWIGRIIDPAGNPLDGRPLARGTISQSLHAKPPAAGQRRALGQRLETGVPVTNTFLPIVRGQRVGLFAGSGVGKSTLLARLATGVEADVVVIAMIGERGREVRHFVDKVLGEKGLERAVVVAATSDQSALLRRRCAWTAMAAAEYFRHDGKSVLFLADSITRFAEAHREIAVASGEAPVLRGYPPSTAQMITQLCERAGTGTDGLGDITGIFSVLVAGSDMDEPIADILRGVLDGHIVLDREIAERGRFPAVDVLRSVSRSLPDAATAIENQTLSELRRLLGVYDRNAMMIRAGLYTMGSDTETDHAIGLWPEIEKFLAANDAENIAQNFRQLELILRRTKVSSSGRQPIPSGKKG